MRLGHYECKLQPDTHIARAYAAETISERHRHRYEVNNDYRKQLENAGMTISGINPDLDLVEAIEIPDHPWLVAVQFHAELKSRIIRAHPLFRDFVAAGLQYKQKLNG